MVTQLHWEDDVVWDGNDIKHKVCENITLGFFLLTDCSFRLINCFLS